MTKLIGAVTLLCVWIVGSAFNDQWQPTSAAYEVRNLSVEDTKTEVTMSLGSTRAKEIINCYAGTEKTIDKIFQSATIYIHVKSGRFNVYVGANPEKVFDESKDSWFNPVARRTTVEVNPFNRTCVFVDAKENYSIQVIVTEVNERYVFLMVAGIVLVLASRTLSRNPAFFYITASILGVVMLLAVVMYYIHQRVAGKVFSATILLGGWTTLVYFLRQSGLEKIFDDYIMYYVVVTGFISFLIAYRIGPPTNPRSKSVMMWALQGLGVAMIFFSSWDENASSMVIGATLLIFYSVQFIVRQKYKRYRTSDGKDKTEKDVEKN